MGIKNLQYLLKDYFDIDSVVNADGQIEYFTLNGVKSMAIYYRSNDSHFGFILGFHSSVFYDADDGLCRMSIAPDHAFNHSNREIKVGVNVDGRFEIEFQLWPDEGLNSLHHMCNYILVGADRLFVSFNDIARSDGKREEGISIEPQNDGSYLLTTYLVDLVTEKGRRAYEEIAVKDDHIKEQKKYTYEEVMSIINGDDRFKKLIPDIMALIDGTFPVLRGKLLSLYPWIGSFIPSNNMPIIDSDIVKKREPNNI